MNFTKKEIINYLILLLIKNVDEGDGASLEMLNNALFQVLRHKPKLNFIDNNFSLLAEIQLLISEKYISENLLRNYNINQAGINFININKSIGLLLKDL
ncbi:MAG: hypothetical protein ACOVOW_11580 [Spirosomataceae bacterium]